MWVLPTPDGMVVRREHPPPMGRHVIPVGVGVLPHPSPVGVGVGVGGVHQRCVFFNQISLLSKFSPLWWLAECC